jgi:hypothetical protein
MVTTPTPEKSIPTPNHEVGTSVSATRGSSSAAALAPPPKLEKARRIERH